MISNGRYHYHLQDVAELKAMPQPLNSADQMRLKQMEDEIAEYEQAHPGEVKRLQ